MDEKILIQSQRLYVRTWKQSDLDRLYHVMSQPRTHLYTQEDPWSREYTKSWLEWHLDHRIGWEVGTFNCPLILRVTDQPIGNVGLNPFLKDERIPEIEWQIGPEHWGRDMRPKSDVPCSPMAFRRLASLLSWVLQYRIMHHQEESWKK